MGSLQVMRKQESRWAGLSLEFLALEMEAGTWSQGMHVTCNTEASQGADSPGAPRGVQSSHTLLLAGGGHLRPLTSGPAR